MSFFHPDLLFTSSFMQKSKNRRGVFYKVHGTFHDKYLWYSFLGWYSWINRFIWCLPTSWKYISHFAQFTQFALSENPITINAWIGETGKRENGCNFRNTPLYHKLNPNENGPRRLLYSAYRILYGRIRRAAFSHHYICG